MKSIVKVSSMVQSMSSVQCLESTVEMKEMTKAQETSTVDSASDEQQHSLQP